MPHTLSEASHWMIPSKLHVRLYVDFTASLSDIKRCGSMLSTFMAKFYQPHTRAFAALCAYVSAQNHRSSDDQPCLLFQSWALRNNTDYTGKHTLPTLTMREWLRSFVKFICECICKTP